MFSILYLKLDNPKPTFQTPWEIYTGIFMVNVNEQKDFYLSFIRNFKMFRMTSRFFVQKNIVNEIKMAPRSLRQKKDYNLYQSEYMRKFPYRYFLTK